MKKLIVMMLLAVMAFTTTQTFAQTKKDGSKDMRYKKNKQPLKKDGTPDKRFKTNKEAKPATKTVKMATPAKKAA